MKLLHKKIIADINYCLGEDSNVGVCTYEQTKDGGCSEVINLAQGTVDLNCTCLHRGINGSRCENRKYKV